MNIYSMTKEEAIKWLRYCATTDCTSCVFQIFSDEFCDGFMLKCADVLEESIADRPIGRWEFRTDIDIGEGRISAGYVCSNCGKDFYHVDGMKYCMNCGAKMDGGEA